MMIALLAALFPPTAAQDCSAYELQAALNEATPRGVADAFAALAACDPAAAERSVGIAFDKVLAGDGGNAVVIQAIEVGADDAARSWLESLQSDERSRTISAIGAACQDSEPVADFLIATRDQLGDAFWTDRWYRSLAECRVAGIQELLQGAIDEGSADRTRFFGVLEVYARNLGAAAVPTLERLAGELESAEEVTYVINAFADAAQVGSLEGQDPEATAAAIAAIGRLAPGLPAQALDQARTTLISLGDEAAASALSAYRYADLLRDDGKLHYGLIAVEVATCKKGDTWLGLHSGEAVEGGALWPDQIRAAAEAAVERQWTFELAKKCKGSAAIEVLLTELPGDEAAIREWTEEQLGELRGREAKKVLEYSPPPLAL